MITENKQGIMECLCRTLQMTRAARDLISLQYDDALGTVTAAYESGRIETVNVAMDSGIAMIRDVIRVVGRD